MKSTALKGKSFIRLKDGLLGLLIIVALILLSSVFKKLAREIRNRKSA